MPPGPKRRTKLVQVLLTPDERRQFDRLKRERNCTMAELVVNAVLGADQRPSIVARVMELEQRVAAHERLFVDLFVDPASTVRSKKDGG